MNFDRVVKELEKQFSKNKITFFSYAWREKLNEYLEEESRYVALIEWIENEINTYQEIINIFNPADKKESYTRGHFSSYKDACANIAMLLNMHGILCDPHTTIEMRANIEETICKIYKIKYVENLSVYIKESEKW